MPSPKTTTPVSHRNTSAIQLGLRGNWQQFLLLVLVNAFVGGMVGIERTLVPLLAGETFGLASKTAILSFIVSFGLVKAGALADPSRINATPMPSSDKEENLHGKNLLWAHQY